MKRTCIIVGRSENGVIGKGGGLPWSKLTDDMKNFQSIGRGNPHIMGRITADSLYHSPLKGPLPGRPCIVVSNKSASYLSYLDTAGFIIASSLDAAISATFRYAGERICIIGGGQIYEQAVKLPIDEIFMTTVFGKFEGDVYCPDLHLELYDKIEEDSRRFEMNERNAHPFIIEHYVLKKL